MIVRSFKTDKMNREEVLNLMRTSKTSEIWAENCAKIKKSHGGSYPEYWYAEVIASGLINEALNSKANRISIFGCRK